MQAMIDHVAAFVIGAIVLFALFAMAATSNDGAIEAVQVDMGKTELRLLVDALEQDMNNMGSGMPNPNFNGTDRVVRTYTKAGAKTTLMFRSLQDDTGTPSPSDVTYEWEPSGTVTFPDGTTTPAFVVTREADGATSTFGTATTFSLRLLKDSPVLGIVEVMPDSHPDSLALVRYVDVAVGLAAPAGTEDLVQRTQWSKRFRPINLDNDRRRIVAAKPPGVP